MFPWIALRSPASFFSSLLTTAASVAPGAFLRAFRWVLPMNPSPNTAIRIGFPNFIIASDNRRRRPRGFMNGIVQHLFAIFIRLGAFGPLLLGVFDSSFLFMPLGNDLLLVALTARDHKMLPVFAVMATAGSVLGCLLVDLVTRKGG